MRTYPPLPAPVDGEDDQNRCQHQSGNDPGDEELSDRFLGDRAVDNEGDAGRDEDAERSPASQQTQDKLLIVPSPHHRRVGDHPDRRRGGGTRPADRREEGAGQDRGDGQPAGQVPDPGVHYLEEIIADPAVEQNPAHQHEERNRNDDKAVERREDGIRNDLHGQIVQEDQEDRGRPQRERHRQPGEEHAQKQQGYEDEAGHADVPPFPAWALSWTTRSTRIKANWKVSSTNPMRSADCGIQSGMRSGVADTLPNCTVAAIIW